MTVINKFFFFSRFRNCTGGRKNKNKTDPMKNQEESERIRNALTQTNRPATDGMMHFVSIVLALGSTHTYEQTKAPGRFDTHCEH